MNKNMRNHAQRKIVSLVACVLLALAGALLISACGQKAENSGNQVGGFKKSLNVANETAAIRTLQTINRSQTQYMLSHGEEYGTFDQLVAEHYLDGRFAGTAPVVEGYVFTIRLSPKGEERSSEYRVNADPKQDDGTSTAGARHLYIDWTSNVVHGNATQPATVNDPPLQ